MNAITSSNVITASGSLSFKTNSSTSDLKRKKSNIENEIRSLSSKKELSSDEKSKEKTRLEEKLRNVKDDLTESKADDIHKQSNEGPDVTKTPSDINKEQQEKDKERKEEEARAEEAKYNEVENGVIVSLSNAKDRLSDMEQLRTKMRDDLRTAETEEEKKELTKKLARVEAQIDNTLVKAREDINDYNSGRFGTNNKKEDDGSGEFSFLNEKENISINGDSESSIGTRYYNAAKDNNDPVKLIIS
ncbi:MAG: hypothetical protein K6F00_00955 [Lachnospiraceae bacterium]|nr:hypothetical protein [Lachnospiraceae bacterium]